MKYVDVEKLCRKYLNDPTYVYKLCEHRWIVVMKKYASTMTNESRKKVVDERFAKFRANKLFVELIIDTNAQMEHQPSIEMFPKEIKNVNTSTYTMSTLYKAGTDVVPNKFYSEENDLICASGIHYFKTLIAAYYYNKCYGHGIVDIKNEDMILDWNENGELSNVITYGEKTHVVNNDNLLILRKFYPNIMFHKENIFIVNMLRKRVLSRTFFKSTNQKSDEESDVKSDEESDGKLDEESDGKQDVYIMATAYSHGFYMDNGVNKACICTFFLLASIAICNRILRT